MKNIFFFLGNFKSYVTEFLLKNKFLEIKIRN